HLDTLVNAKSIDGNALRAVMSAGAAHCLDDDGFAYLFSRPVPRALRFDLQLKVELPPALRLGLPTRPSLGSDGVLHVAPVLQRIQAVPGSSATPRLGFPVPSFQTAAHQAVLRELTPAYLASLHPRLPTLDGYSALCRRAHSFLHRALGDRCY